MFKNSYVSKINQNVYIESPKNFLSFKIILDKAGGMGTELAKNDYKIFNNNIGK